MGDTEASGGTGRLFFMAVNYQKQAESILNSQEKASSELLALMYGSLVTQIVADLETVEQVNAELLKLGHDCGTRLIEDFVSRSTLSHCQTFRDTCEVIAKVAFRVYLGVAGELTRTNETDPNVCFITLAVNPLADFVELPPSLVSLNYNAYVCGVIQGALEQIQMKVTCEVTKDALVDSSVTEFRLELVELLKEAFIDLEDN